jgi:hypothetical protein
MAYINKEYVAISNIYDNSFKQPRQKMWGVFVAGKRVTSSNPPINKWNLVYLSNDFEGAKDFYNEWLQNPDITDYNLAGSDNAIMVEILPINSKTRL